MRIIRPSETPFVRPATVTGHPNPGNSVACRDVHPVQLAHRLVADLPVGRRNFHQRIFGSGYALRISSIDRSSTPGSRTWPDCAIRRGHALAARRPIRTYLLLEKVPPELLFQRRVDGRLKQRPLSLHRLRTADHRGLKAHTAASAVARYSAKNARHGRHVKSSSRVGAPVISAA